MPWLASATPSAGQFGADSRHPVSGKALLMAQSVSTKLNVTGSRGWHQTSNTQDEDSTTTDTEKDDPQRRSGTEYLELGTTGDFVANPHRLPESPACLQIWTVRGCTKRIRVGKGRPRCGSSKWHAETSDWWYSWAARHPMVAPLLSPRNQSRFSQSTGPGIRTLLAIQCLPSRPVHAALDLKSMSENPLDLYRLSSLSAHGIAF